MNGPLNTSPPRGGFYYDKPDATPEVGQAGLYCVYCHGWKLYADLLPLGQNKYVRPMETFKLGESVGRCPQHLAKGREPVSLVTRSN